MSGENVELARRYYAAYNERGLYETDELRHPEIEVFDPPTLPDADRYVGRKAIRELLESYLEVGWDGIVHDPEFLDAGDEVLVLWHMLGESGHGGGYPIDTTVAHLLTFEDGMVKRIRQFLGREEGLRAAGL